MAKVVIAMSGGVDSSVAAYLLKQAGHDVTGLMLRLWSEPGKENSNRCCTPDSVAQARKVAAQLDIPFYVIDAKQAFYDQVVQGFLDGYAAGITPNPCISCNRHIRFDLLFNHALALGAEFMSTGHYVRKEVDADGDHILCRAVDDSKDQSYVLHVLPQNVLRQTLFPVGEHPKTRIREIATEIGLSVAKRPDSQDLCFLAGEDYRSFLRRHLANSTQPVDITDTAGTILGRHNGLHQYTIGQRKGLGLTTALPYYVVKKDQTNNRLIVGDAGALGSTHLTAAPMVWSKGTAPAQSFHAMVKTRYTAKLAPAQVTVLNGGGQISAVFDEPQRDITPGQAAVLYIDDRVIGGGIIQNPTPVSD